MTSSTRRWAVAFVLAAVGLCGLGFGQDPTEDSPKAKKTPPPGTFRVPPPPADTNDLSLEVAALRTIMLMNVWPDSDLRPNSGTWKVIYDRGIEKGCAEKARTRPPANVSEAYKKVLTDLRAALITDQTDRVVELSDRLDELTEDEEPELDDEVGITAVARKNAQNAALSLAPEQVIGYLNAYGKDFPDPRELVRRATRGTGKGEKPSKETREFVIREVAWQLGGLDPAKQKPIADKVAAMLDKADKLTNQEAKRLWAEGGTRPNDSLLKDWVEIRKGIGPLDILKHVLEQDLAELLSNSGTIPAMKARIAYLKAAGYNTTLLK
jgi:hypothetical protein